MTDQRTAANEAPVSLMASDRRASELRAESLEWPSWDLTARQLCDLELLMSGGFAPLRGFLGAADHAAVCAQMRLADGTLWPLPIALDVPDHIARTLESGTPLALRDPEGVMLAALHVDEVYRPDRQAEAQAVLGTADPSHPGAEVLLHRTHPWYVGGRIEAVELPTHHDFQDLRRTPAAIRTAFQAQGATTVLAFPVHTPIHRAEHEASLGAARRAGAHLLVHGVIGPAWPGEVDRFTRVRCYRAIMHRYPPETATLSLLPLASRRAGRRESLWQAIVHRNYGCSHLLIDEEALDLLRRHEDELGVTAVTSGRTAHGREPDWRADLATGRDLPAGFTFPEVAAELRRTYRARAEQGFTVFFTGLSGSGKSTIANALRAKLLERGGRSVTLLDGDLVRKHLSSELGFSREHRDLNIRRIGFVAAEITRHGGVAICAPIAPYDRTRKAVRTMVSAGGGFVLVHVATPVDVCEARDRKGLYAKARAGMITEFTGVSDPYEVPGDAEIVIDTAEQQPEEAAAAILAHLEKGGYLSEGPGGRIAAT